MAAPVFVNNGSVDSGTGASVSPTYMGSIVADDFLFLLAISNQSGGAVGGMDVPAGWTLLDASFYKDTSPATVGQVSLYFRKATGSESGTVTINRTGATGLTYSFGAQIYQFRELRTVIESYSVNATGDGSSPIVWNAITVNGNERTLIAFVAQATSSNPGTPAGYTQDALDTISSGGVDIGLKCSSKVNVSADGSVNTATGVSSNGWVTYHLSLFVPVGRSFIVN